MPTLVTAVLFLSAGKLLFAIQDVIIKEMSGGYPVHQLVVLRGLIAVPLLLGIIASTIGLGSLRGPLDRLLIVRGVLIFAAFVVFYIALSVMPLTTVTALFFTAPFFITLLAIPMLGERVGVNRLTAIAVGFAGVLVVLRPGFGGFRIEGLLPIAAALMYALAQILARRVALSATASVMTLYANVMFVLLGLLMGGVIAANSWPAAESVSMQFVLRSWQLPTARDGVLMSLTGISAAFGFLLSTEAYRRAEVNRVAPFEYVMLLWVTLLAWFYWGEVPDRHTLIGGAIIIGSGLFVLKREGQRGRRFLTHKSLTRR